MTEQGVQFNQIIVVNDNGIRDSMGTKVLKQIHNVINHKIISCLFCKVH